MNSILAVMRMFHYMVGITAPDKKQERLVLGIWIGLAVGLIVLGLLFTLFIVPRVLAK